MLLVRTILLDWLWPLDLDNLLNYFLTIGYIITAILLLMLDVNEEAFQQTLVEWIRNSWINSQFFLTPSKVENSKVAWFCRKKWIKIVSEKGIFNWFIPSIQVNYELIFFIFFWQWIIKWKYVHIRCIHLFR